MGKFFDFLKKKQPQQSSFVQQQLVPQQQPQQQEIPQYDGANAIQYFSQLMGPTPAEREAQERKLLENKRKMIAWTGFFDGIRQLGNLYYASKGATPQQYTDKPYQQIEKNYQQERQLQDYLQRNRQAYAKQLFDWQQKISDTERRDALSKAQQSWYGTRSEIAEKDAEIRAQRAEIDRLKKEAEIRRTDAQTDLTNEKKNTETGERRKLLSAQAQKNRQQGSAAVTRANNSGKSGDGSKKNKNAKSGTSSNQNSTQKISTGVNWKKKK